MGKVHSEKTDKSQEEQNQTKMETIMLCTAGVASIQNKQ
jgi:hypothetical protein